MWDQSGQQRGEERCAPYVPKMLAESHSPDMFVEPESSPPVWRSRRGGVEGRSHCEARYFDIFGAFSMRIHAHDDDGLRFF